MTRRIGILTGGGDAPGLNAVIRAFVKRGVSEMGWDIVGVEDSYNGLLETPRRLVPMDLKACQGLLHRGGTVLGTTNHGNPFAFDKDGKPSDLTNVLVDALADEKIEGLCVIGGDGTMQIALQLMEKCGIKTVGVPKTIDNDLSATDVTFGFQSAVDCATDALDRLHTTAASHDRVMFLEVMGRDVGHIALHSGIAGGADVILLPEIPYDPERVASKIRYRQSIGRTFSIVVVAEGALPREADGRELTLPERKRQLKEGGGAASIAMATLSKHVQAEMRATVLGHLQRGGSPVAFDRLLATRFGVAAVDLIAENRWGEMVRIRDGHVGGVSLKEAAITRPVSLQDELIRTARAVGVEFGG